MTTSIETQKILDQLKTIQQTNGQVTIQDFSDLIPAVSQDLANKNTLFYAGENPTDKLYIAAKNISKDGNNPLIIIGSTQFNDLMFNANTSLLRDPPSTALLNESQIGFLKRGVAHL